MKVTMVLVSSLNGKLTMGSGPDIQSWASKEDFKFFSSLRDRHSLIIMGRKTYEAVREEIKLDPKKMRIVLTREPSKYAKDAVVGSLEFTNETPVNLLKRLESKGYRNALVVGGSEINGLFLKANLVGELYLTIEPKIFGKGKPFVTEDDLELQMKLVRIRKLNKLGTLNLKYTFKK